ncbi:MAG: hypothetical protein LUQ50_13655 [Methanospirillum sp.]|uniref:hypothetical protein n=1 Tax=Methanospirillum sp. TaxID=45200 RepID=UPI00236C0759|nr:hypothetical protein [Methanospirillum sp.]MDD1730102.1 hypothetical protein [Methanospirillum sp.]
MHIINKAVTLIESMVEDCGISDNPVILEQESEVVRCAHERGALLRVTFGGRSAGIATDDPVRITTKPSFMFGASLGKPALRSAAAGILNALTGFLCTSRKLHACLPESHISCMKELESLLAGKKIWCCGTMDNVRDRFSSQLVASPEEADVILVSADGMISDEHGFIPEEPGEKYLFVGPSTAGVAVLTHSCHYCPYGRTNI